MILCDDDLDNTYVKVALGPSYRNNTCTAIYSNTKIHLVIKVTLCSYVQYFMYNRLNLFSLACVFKGESIRPRTKISLNFTLGIFTSVI